MLLKQKVEPNSASTDLTPTSSMPHFSLLVSVSLIEMTVDFYTCLTLVLL